MEYEMLSSTERIEIIDQRILNLEKHIFHNEMLLSEHDGIGLFDEEGLDALRLQIDTYSDQIVVLKQLKNSI
jgi:hypothetical protein